MKMNKQSYRAIALLLLIVAASAGYAQSGVKYPYVLDGKIIVSRDARGGVDTKFLHPNWTDTPDHQYDDPSKNCVAWKFEVAEAEELNATSCPSGWRIPTQKELWLMYAVRRQLKSDVFVEPEVRTYLLSSTKKELTATTITYFCCDCLNELFSFRPMPSSCKVRCIRDLD